MLAGDKRARLSRPSSVSVCVCPGLRWLRRRLRLGCHTNQTKSASAPPGPAGRRRSGNSSLAGALICSCDLLFSVICFGGGGSGRRRSASGRVYFARRLRFSSSNSSESSHRTGRQIERPFDPPGAICASLCQCWRARARAFKAKAKARTRSICRASARDHLIAMLIVRAIKQSAAASVAAAAVSLTVRRSSRLVSSLFFAPLRFGVSSFAAAAPT